MTVIFIASECAPIAKVGGLADVVGSLPKALEKLGVTVKIIIPNYGVIDKEKFPQEKIVDEPEIFFDHKLEKFSVYRSILPQTSVEVFLIDQRFFSGGVYLSADATPHSIDEISRFAFLSEAALEFLKESDIVPDVIHCHDWHTAIVPDLLKVRYANVGKFKKTATVLTIHNLGVRYQGKADPVVLHILDLDFESLPQIAEDLASGDINFLQQGIVSADFVNTVSHQYAREILTAELGGKLAPYLRERQDRLFGILNGIDTEVFNPASDKLIAQNYDLKSWQKGKAENKRKLESEVGFSTNKKFLIGMVTRLDDQKGLDLALKVLPSLSKFDVRIAILGRGDPQFEKSFGQFCQVNPETAFCSFKFDPALANLIYAGSDAFLMPSRFEPCGLGQMIAMRYGTLPIVRDVGGLHDTVVDGVTGFVFKNYDYDTLSKTIIRAKNVFENKERWAEMVKTAMSQDFSWKRSAAEYVKLYDRAKLLKSRDG